MTSQSTYTRKNNFLGSRLQHLESRNLCRLLKGKDTVKVFFDIIALFIKSSARRSDIYRVSQEEWTKLRESVPYVKIYRYNPKHLCPNLNKCTSVFMKSVRYCCPILVKLIFSRQIFRKTLKYQIS